MKSAKLHTIRGSAPRRSRHATHERKRARGVRSQSHALPNRMVALAAGIPSA